MTRTEQLTKSLEYFNGKRKYCDRLERKHIEVAISCIERVLRLERIIERYER